MRVIEFVKFKRTKLKGATKVKVNARRSLREDDRAVLIVRFALPRRLVSNP